MKKGYRAGWFGSLFGGTKIDYSNFGVAIVIL